MRLLPPGRLRFLVSVVFAVAVAIAAVRSSFALLEPLAALLAPHGINAGTAQNVMIIGGCGLALLILWSATHSRLSDLGESPIWAPAVLVPPAALLLVDGPLFIRPIFDVPDTVWWAVMGICAAIGVAVFLNCALRPGISRQAR